MCNTSKQVFLHTQSHVALPKRNKRRKRLCTNVFSLLWSWNEIMVALQKIQQIYHAIYTMIQVAGSVCNLLLVTSPASVSSLLAIISPTFKTLKINLQVSLIFLIYFKFIFFWPSFQGQHIPPSPLPKLDYMVFLFRLPIGSLQSCLP